MSNKKLEKDDLHVSHIDIPRAPYSGNFASFGLLHRAFACDHDLYSRLFAMPCEKLTAAIDSFFKHPQLCVFPESNWSATTSFDPPQSHEQSHLTRRPFSLDRLITVNLPNLLPAKLFNRITISGYGLTQGLYHG